MRDFVPQLKRLCWMQMLTQHLAVVARTAEMSVREQSQSAQRRWLPSREQTSCFLVTQLTAMALLRACPLSMRWA